MRPMFPRTGSPCITRTSDLSPYHRERIRRVGDLGMLGEPDCFYRAVKR